MHESARAFRRAPTRAETLLWQAIRNRKLDGRKFRRQQPIGSFVVDFFCAAERLVVEIDGPIHDGQREADLARQAAIESTGARFLRLSNDDVESRLSESLRRIQILFGSSEAVE